MKTGEQGELAVTDVPLQTLDFLSRYTSKPFSLQLCWFLELIYRVSLISCVSQPAGNHTISADYIISLPSSTLVETSPLNTDTTSGTTPTPEPQVVVDVIDVIAHVDASESNQDDAETDSTKPVDGTSADGNSDSEDKSVEVDKDDVTSV